MNDILKKVSVALNNNNIDTVIAKTRRDATEIVRGMLFEGCSIRSGGSMSLIESGVWDLIQSEKYNFRDRSRVGISDSERQEIFRSVIGCDFYLCSANAVTENGELLNVDGLGNRVSAITFGPKKIIMVVGKNKIVPDLHSAFLRVKRIAAPKNCVRLNLDNPCAKLGHCVSLLQNDSPDFTDGCKNKTRICCDYLISGFQREKGRITVVLVNEDLGY